MFSLCFCVKLAASARLCVAFPCRFGGGLLRKIPSPPSLSCRRLQLWRRFTAALWFILLVCGCVAAGVLLGLVRSFGGGFAPFHCAFCKICGGRVPARVLASRRPCGVQSHLSSVFWGGCWGCVDGVTGCVGDGLVDRCVDYSLCVLAAVRLQRRRRKRVGVGPQCTYADAYLLTYMWRAG